MTATEATIHNLESQLIEIYQEKDILNHEIGMASADELVHLFQRLKAEKEAKTESAMVESLSQQLCELYREKDQLNSALGTADPAEIIQMVKNLEAQLVSLYAEKETPA